MNPKRSPWIYLAVLLLGLACSPSPAAQPESSAQADSPPRKPANVLSWEVADWLEREGRAELEKPEIVLRAMDLHDGDMVADLGAGTGFFSRRIAHAVAPSGKVYANDLQPEMLDKLKELAAHEKITNIVTVLGTETDPNLPKATFDWILMVDVYHELQQPRPVLARIKEALKPNGRVALVEYRLEGETAKHIDLTHRMSVEQVVAEWSPAGFELIETIEELPSQHLFVFKVRR
ncbi:MAG TPA: class I SAM-dependent methyltransferase [Thermoanaerobaculia bacterium]|nr:class I SAM-dependent methyltransferase [Thermoanaerobaculia bacterium]